MMSRRRRYGDVAEEEEEEEERPLKDGKGSMVLDTWRWRGGIGGAEKLKEPRGGGGGGVPCVSRLIHKRKALYSTTSAI